MSWKFLEDQQPELAAFGDERLNGKVGYLATIRKDGSPRVHPMTPIIGQGHLFVFMEPTSPTGHDPQRDGRYAIHCSMSDTSGASGEFVVTGQAHVIDNPELRALAASLASYAPADRYILFEFDIESAASTIYPDDRPVRQFVREEGNVTLPGLENGQVNAGVCIPLPNPAVQPVTVQLGRKAAKSSPCR